MSALVLVSWSLLLAGADGDAATELAKRVHKAAGGDRLSEVKELEFTFVVYGAEQKKLSEIKHTWNLATGRDHVVWTDRTGKARDVVVDLAKPRANEDEEKAYARWVNDSYWLILPLKLLDHGVKRTLEEKRQHGGKTYEVLRLEFDKVGLTPGDKYWLFIDPATARIERWEMVLEGEQPPPKGNSFTDYKAVGPLTLAMDHLFDDGKVRILFEGVKATTR